MVIIEDETIVCKLLERAFGKDYQLSVFESAEAFQAEFDASVPHVLLTDKNLPGITGIELVERHRQVTGDFEAVLITGYADIDSVILSMDLGIFSYVRKPFEIQELKYTVANAQDRLTRRLHRRDALEQAQSTLAEYAGQLEQAESPANLAEIATGLKDVKETLAQVTTEMAPRPRGPGSGS